MCPFLRSRIALSFLATKDMGWDSAGREVSQPQEGATSSERGQSSYEPVSRLHLPQRPRRLPNRDIGCRLWRWASHRIQDVGGPAPGQVSRCHLPPGKCQEHLWDKMPTPHASDLADHFQEAPYAFLIPHFLYSKIN